MAASFEKPLDKKINVHPHNHHPAPPDDRRPKTDRCMLYQEHLAAASRSFTVRQSSSSTTGRKNKQRTVSLKRLESTLEKTIQLLLITLI